MPGGGGNQGTVTLTPMQAGYMTPTIPAGEDPSWYAPRYGGRDGDRLIGYVLTNDGAIYKQTAANQAAAHDPNAIWQPASFANAHSGGTSTAGQWVVPSSGGGGKSSPLAAISDAVASVGQAVSNAVSGAVNTAVNTVNAVIQNPLPVIETIALTAALGPEGALSTGLTASQNAAIANAAVSAANGGDVTKIATAALTSAASSAASNAVSSAVSNAIAPDSGVPTPVSGTMTPGADFTPATTTVPAPIDTTVATTTPVDTTATPVDTTTTSTDVGTNAPGMVSASTARIIASAAGADAAATVKAIGAGKNIGDALVIGLDAALPGVSKTLTADYVTGLAQGTVSDSIAVSLGNVAGAAAGGATDAALKGQDILAGAEDAASKSAKDELLSQIGQNLPDVSLPDLSLSDLNLPSIDLPKLDLPSIDLPKIDLPKLDLSGLNLPDINLPKIDLPNIDLPKIDLPKIDLPNVNLPDINLPKFSLPDVNLPNISLPDINLPSIDTSGLKNAAKSVSDTVSDVGNSISNAASNVDVKNLSGTDLLKYDPAYNTPTTPTTPTDAVSQSTTIGGAAGPSAAAFGAQDVAITAPEDVASKGEKKSAKYPWGTPEGTSALKEGLGI